MPWNKRLKRWKKKLYKAFGWRVDAPPQNGAEQLLRKRWEAVSPLRVLPAIGNPRRVNLVTDSLNKGSLYGGVGTSLIFAALLARRTGSALRIVTRTEPIAQPGGVAQLLACNGIECPARIESAFAPPYGTQAEVDLGSGDRFLTTSWWTTACVRAAIDPERIVWLMQEDERMFYPNGDDRRACENLMRDRALRCVVNSELLYEHLLAEGFEHLRERGLAFEPAFPRQKDPFPPRVAGGKMNFFFYARPQNHRNLFWTGLQVIEAALARGVLNPAEWNFHFVGRNIPACTIGDGVVPTRHEDLSWGAYGELLSTMDLGLSLMDTPHPSYPPLDLAAAGAIAVTNRCGLKQTLAKYSANILCVEPTLPALVEGVRAGAARARDFAARERDRAANGLRDDWSTAFEAAVAAIFREM